MLPPALAGQIQAAGFFPEFIVTTVARTLGQEAALSSVVHREATFDHDALHRHLTVLVLTPTRLIVSHTDDGEGASTAALTTVESVPLGQIRSVTLTNVVADPSTFRPGQALDEVWLAVGWGALRRVEIAPATCGDPECTAEHGFDLTNLDDDLTVRMSTAADGDENVERLVDFAVALQLATGR